MPFTDRQQSALSLMRDMPEFEGWSDDEITKNITDVISSDDTERQNKTYSTFQNLNAYQDWDVGEIGKNLGDVFGGKPAKVPPSEETPKVTPGKFYRYDPQTKKPVEYDPMAARMPGMVPKYDIPITPRTEEPMSTQVAIQEPQVTAPPAPAAPPPAPGVPPPVPQPAASTAVRIDEPVIPEGPKIYAGPKPEPEPKEEPLPPSDQWAVDIWDTVRSGYEKERERGPDELIPSPGEPDYDPQKHNPFGLFDSASGVVIPEPRTKEEKEGYLSQIKRNWQYGKLDTQLDVLAFENLINDDPGGYYEKTKPLKEQYQKLLEEDPAEAKNLLSKFFLGAVRMAPGMAQGYKEGLPVGAAAGVGAAIIGQIPPFTALPEEIVAVPGAFASGIQLGSMKFWLKQGAGAMYGDMLDEGQDPDISKYSALLAAAPYAAIEFLQFGQFFRGVLPGLAKGAKEAVRGSVTKALKQITKTYGKNWALEVSEEGLQEIVQIVSVDVNRSLDNYFNTKGEKGKSIKDKFMRVVNTLLESMGPMLLMGLPGAGVAATKATVTEIAAKPEAPAPTPTKPPPEPMSIPEVPMDLKIIPNFRTQMEQNRLLAEEQRRRGGKPPTKPKEPPTEPEAPKGKITGKLLELHKKREDLIRQYDRKERTETEHEYFRDKIGVIEDDIEREAGEKIEKTTKKYVEQAKPIGMRDISEPWGAPARRRKDEPIKVYKKPKIEGKTDAELQEMLADAEELAKEEGLPKQARFHAVMIHEDVEQEIAKRKGITPAPEPAKPAEKPKVPPKKAEKKGAQEEPEIKTSDDLINEVKKYIDPETGNVKRGNDYFAGLAEKLSDDEIKKAIEWTRGESKYIHRFLGGDLNSILTKREKEIAEEPILSETTEMRAAAAIDEKAAVLDKGMLRYNKKRNGIELKLREGMAGKPEHNWLLKRGFQFSDNKQIYYRPYDPKAIKDLEKTYGKPITFSKETVEFMSLAQLELEEKRGRVLEKQGAWLYAKGKVNLLDKSFKFDLPEEIKDYRDKDLGPKELAKTYKFIFGKMPRKKASEVKKEIDAAIGKGTTDLDALVDEFNALYPEQAISETKTTNRDDQFWQNMLAGMQEKEPAPPLKKEVEVRAREKKEEAIKAKDVTRVPSEAEVQAMIEKERKPAAAKKRVAPMVPPAKTEAQKRYIAKEFGQEPEYVSKKELDTIVSKYLHPEYRTSIQIDVAPMLRWKDYSTGKYYEMPVRGENAAAVWLDGDGLYRVVVSPDIGFDEYHKFIKHEVVGHIGIANAIMRMPETRQSLIDIFQSDRNSAWTKDLAKKYGEGELFSEWLVERILDHTKIKEQGRRRSVAQRVYNVIQNYFRKLYFKVKGKQPTTQEKFAKAMDELLDEMQKTPRGAMQPAAFQTPAAAKRGRIEPMAESDFNKVIAAAIKVFGKPKQEMDRHGYILPDGGLLDVEGEHGDILQAFKEAGVEVKDWPTAIEKFKNSGAIRVDTELIDLSNVVQPTAAQKAALRKKLKDSNYAVVSIDDWFKEYGVAEEGENTEQIMTDIENAYKRKAPPTTVQQFAGQGEPMLARREMPTIRKPETAFYSALERALTKIAQKKPFQSGEAAYNKIKKAYPGVTDVEMEWVLGDLKARKGSVTMAEIREMAAANMVTVEETTKRMGILNTGFVEIPTAEFWDAKARDVWLDNLKNKFNEEFGRPLPIDETYEDEVFVKKINDQEVVWLEDNYNTRKMDKLGLDKTKHSKWVLPGGENYREVLFRMPLEISPVLKKREEMRQRFHTPEKYTDEELAEAQEYIDKTDKQITKPAMGFQTTHWEEPNVFAHARLNDRTTPDGKKVLFIEEIQSDWEGKVRREGIKKKPLTAAEEKELDRIEDKFVKTNEITWDEAEKRADLIKKKLAAEGGVPDFPLRKNWKEYVLKRVLRMAAEGDYDQVAWVTGEQTAERYDLSKEVDKVTWIPGDKTIRAYKGTEIIFSQTLENENKIADYIGKEPARRLLAAELTDDKITAPQKEISGKDLKVGGQWAKQLYDVVIPNTMNKLGKKWGAAVGDVKSPSTRGISGRFDVRKVTTGWMIYSIKDKANYDGPFNTKKEAENALSTLMKPTDQPSIPVTESMKDAVLYQGQPMFAKKRAEQLEMFPVEREMPEGFAKSKEVEQLRPEDVPEGDLFAERPDAEQLPMLARRPFVAEPEPTPERHKEAEARKFELFRMEKEIKRFRGKLMSVPKSKIAERAKIQLMIQDMKAGKEEKVRSAIFNYARKIKLGDDPFHKVRRLILESKTSGNFLTAMDIMDDTLYRRTRSELKKKVVLVLGLVKKQIRGFAGRRVSPWPVEYNRRLAEYIQQIEMGEPENLEQIEKDLVWSLEHSNEEMPEALLKRMQDLFRSNINLMTNKELNEVLQNIESIKKSGRALRQMEREDEKLVLDKQAQGAVIEMNHYKVPDPKYPFLEASKKEDERRLKGAQKAKKNLIYNAAKYFWMHIRPERICEWYDGWKKGLVYNNVMPHMLKSEANKIRVKKQLMDVFYEKHKKIDVVKAQIDIVYSPKYYMVDRHGFISPTPIEKPMTLSKMMHIYANSKNPGNRAHLEGTGITEDIIDDISSELAENHPDAKEAVDGMIYWWDNEGYDMVNEEFSKENFVDMPKEHDYFPIRNLYTDRKENALVTDLLARYSAHMAKVRFGATKGRIKSRAPFRTLDYFGTVLGALNDQGHYIAYNESVRHVRRFLNHKDLKREMIEKDEHAYRNLVEYVNANALGTLATPEGGKGAIGFLNKHADNLRKLFYPAVLGVNMITSIKQTASLAQGMRTIGPKQVANSSATFLRDLVKWPVTRDHPMVKFVKERSSMMANRHANWEREMAELHEKKEIEKVMGTRKKMDTFREIVMKPIQLADQATTTILWYAKYHDMVNQDNVTEEQAIAAADEVIRKTQPMGGIAHMPSVYRGAGLERAYTMFTNQLNQNFNILFEMIDKPGTPKSKAMDVFFYMLVPSTLIYLATHGFEPPWDDPEGWARAFVSNEVGGLLFFNRMLEVATKEAADISREKRGALVRKNPMQERSGAGWQTARLISGLLPAAFGRYADFMRFSVTHDPEYLVDVVSKSTGIPTSQPKRTFKAIKRAVTGEIEDPREFIWSRYAIRDKSIPAAMAYRLMGKNIITSEMVKFFEWYKRPGNEAKLKKYVEGKNMSWSQVKSEVGIKTGKLWDRLDKALNKEKITQEQFDAYSKRIQ